MGQKNEGEREDDTNNVKRERIRSRTITILEVVRYADYISSSRFYLRNNNSIIDLEFSKRKKIVFTNSSMNCHSLSLSSLQVNDGEKINPTTREIQLGNAFLLSDARASSIIRMVNFYC